MSINHKQIQYIYYFMARFHSTIEQLSFKREKLLKKMLYNNERQKNNYMNKLIHLRRVLALVKRNLLVEKKEAFVLL
jgi:hypothetical protein